MPLRWLVYALTLLLLPHLFPRIKVRSFFAALGAAVLIGLVSATLGQVAQLLAFPLTVLTLGLFYFVVNGLMFLLSGKIWSGFRVEGFWTAFFGAIVYTAVSGLALRALGAAP